MTDHKLSLQLGALIGENVVMWFEEELTAAVAAQGFDLCPNCYFNAAVTVMLSHVLKDLSDESIAVMLEGIATAVYLNIKKRADQTDPPEFPDKRPMN